MSNLVTVCRMHQAGDQTVMLFERSEAECYWTVQRMKGLGSESLGMMEREYQVLTTRELGEKFYAEQVVAAEEAAANVGA